MYKLSELEERTLKWCDEKGILSKGNKFVQTLKLVSEVGELYESTDHAETIDAIGDILIVLTSIIYHTRSIKISGRSGLKIAFYKNLVSAVGDLCDNIIKDKLIDGEIDLIIGHLNNIAAQLGVSIEHCWETSLHIVEKRTGFMNSNGDFIKLSVSYVGEITPSGDFEPGEPNV